MSNKPWSKDRINFHMTALRQRREREASKTPVPQRITTALDIRGLYGPEVDVACGAEEPAVDRWEDPNDPLLPTAEQVELLAKLTGYPVLFFYLRPTPAIGPMFLCGEDGREIVDNRPPAQVDELAAYRRKHR